MNYLVVGCGLTGSVIARELADRGKKVEIWERRDRIGGNMYDYIDEHGFLVQKYGPHAFYTTKLIVCKEFQWWLTHRKRKTHASQSIKNCQFRIDTVVSYAVEYPLPYREEEKVEPYYQVLAVESQGRYAKYVALAQRISNLISCGRLADFKYYNMDQALERALSICGAR
ncbi:NAD(P)-binding protein [Oscillospiraceae bacterium 50-16]